MKIYAIYSKLVSSKERDTLLAPNIYPNPAEYGDFYLFASSYFELTGDGHPNSEDISELPVDADFDLLVEGMMAQEHTGREVIISADQGRHLYSTVFKPVDEEI